MVRCFLVGFAGVGDRRECVNGIPVRAAGAGADGYLGDLGAGLVWVVLFLWWVCKGSFEKWICG